MKGGTLFFFFFLGCERVLGVFFIFFSIFLSFNICDVRVVASASACFFLLLALLGV